MPHLRRLFALEGHSLLTKTGSGRQRRYNAVRRPIILSSLSSLVVIAILIACLPRHDRFGDQASILAYGGFDLVGDVGIFLEELLGVFTTLTDALAVIGKPGAGFLDDVGLDAKVDQLPVLDTPSPYMMSNSTCLNGGANLFLTTLTRVWLPITSSRSLMAPMRRMSRRTEA